MTIVKLHADMALEVRQSGQQIYWAERSNRYIGFRFAELCDADRLTDADCTEIDLEVM